MKPSSSSEPPATGAAGLRLDATALRILAHPLRSRLLSRLRSNGPATATELAAELGTNSGATSYHLRKLESVGLVRDDGEGQGRRRVWSAATDYHSFYVSDVAGDEDAETAINWLSRDYSRRLAEHFEHWLDAEGSWPLPWRDAAGMSDSMVLVTADQLAALQEELSAVIARYRRAGQDDSDARRVVVYQVAYPADLDAAPNRDAEG